MKKTRIFKRCTALFVAIIMIVTSGVTVFATEYTRYDRLTQPSVRYTFAPGELGVVNFETTWGDKEANVERMIDYIEEAYEEGVKILLFPEMCVTGYASSSDPSSEIYQMAVKSAETVDGPTATTISALSDEYDMWIIYGATEVVPGDSEHAYNSAFACSPDGEVVSYQKISPVEGSWCTPGENPVLIDAGEYGLIGLSICYDTYAMPEIGRYYAAKGCNLLLNPTATSRSYSDVDGDGERDDIGWEWYYKNRIESITSREGFTMLSANLVGGDGPIRSNGSYTYNFPGGSVILRNGTYYYAGTTTADGTSDENADIITGVAGLLTNSTSLTASTGSTCRNADFQVEYYAKWYDELADMQEAGESLSYSSDVTDGPVAAVVNMAAVWGDKQANIDKMIEYIEEAAQEGVEILVFPETVLTGYEWQGEDDPYYKEQGVYMQVALAETIPGETTNLLSEYAEKYNMYIIFGMTEKLDEPIYDDGVEKVYNSAAILYPDGKIESYQKMHRAGYETMWSICGDTPYMFDTEWGRIGIDICRDGHFYPELGRYYAANGCTLLIHPTATTGNPWYRETRIGSYTDRDGMAAITCNLLGPDGTYDEETDTWSGGVFASTSLIITKYHNANGSTGFDPETGYAIDLNGTGSASEGFDERGTSPEGLEIAKMDLSGCGFRLTNFNARLFSRMYDELAVLYRDGYESIYGESSVTVQDSASENERFTITAVTSEDVTSVALYNSNDKKISISALSSEDNGDGTRTWYITTSLGTAGVDREIKIVENHGEGYYVDNGLRAYITITSEMPEIISTDIPENTVAGMMFNFTVTTSASAKKLSVYNENGAKLGISGLLYVDASGTRVWSGNMSIGTSGSRVLTVSVSDKFGFEGSTQVPVTVSPFATAA